MTDNQHLKWLRDRLINVHGENPNYDYMLRFEKIIAKVEAANSEKTKDGWFTKSTLRNMTVDELKRFAGENKGCLLELGRRALNDEIESECDDFEVDYCPECGHEFY